MGLEAPITIYSYPGFVAYTFLCSVLNVSGWNSRKSLIINVSYKINNFDDN